MNNDYEIRGDTTAIFLRRKDGTILEALIDTEDFDKVNAYAGRKCNLKVCTHSENMKNMKTRICQQTTKGTIYWHKTKNYWVSRIVIEKKTIFQKCNKEKTIVEEALKNKLLELGYPLDDLQKVC